MNRFLLRHLPADSLPFAFCIRVLDSPTEILMSWYHVQYIIMHSLCISCNKLDSLSGPTLSCQPRFPRLCTKREVRRKKNGTTALRTCRFGSDAALCWTRYIHASSGCV